MLIRRQEQKESILFLLKCKESESTTESNNISSETDSNMIPNNIANEININDSENVSVDMNEKNEKFILRKKAGQLHLRSPKHRQP